MATSTWISGVNGDWDTPAFWSTFITKPGAADDASITAGPGVGGKNYTVTVTKAESALSLLLNSTAATLDISAGLTIGTTFNAIAGILQLDSTGTIAGGKFVAGGATQFWIGGTLSNLNFQGTMDLSPTGVSATLAGNVNFLNFSKGIGTVTLTGTNAALDAVAGATLDGATVNFDNGASIALTGGPGTLTLGAHNDLLTAAFNQGHLTSAAVAGNTIVNQGTIDLEGGQFTIDPTVFNNTGTIILGPGGSTLNVPNGLTNNGTMIFAGGFNNGSGTLTVGKQGTITGQGSIHNPIANAGKIIATGGTLQIAGALSGAGQVSIASDATLKLDFDSANITFAPGGTHETLILDLPQGLSGTLVSLAATHTIAIPLGFGITSAALSGNTLNVFGSGFQSGPLSIPLSQAPNPSIVVPRVVHTGSFDSIVLDRLAQPSVHTPEPVGFGVHHVGDVVTQAITITNTVIADVDSEALNATLSGFTGAATTVSPSANGFTGLAPQATSSQLQVGLDTKSDGVKSGTATIGFQSGSPAVDLPSQTVNVTGTVYALASATVTPVLNLGAIRLGGPTLSAFPTVTNGTTQDLFQEDVTYNYSSVPAALSASTVPVTVASGGNSSVKISLPGTAAGDFTNSKVTVGFTSQAVAGTGLSDTILPSQTITVNGKVYAPAVAALSAKTLDFGIVHVGDKVSQSVTITNTASAALTDQLSATVNPNNVTGGFFIGFGSTGFRNVPTITVPIGITTTAAAVATGSYTQAISSTDFELSDISLGTGTVTLSGTVDNFATLALQLASGGHQLVHTGTAYQLDLGQVPIGGASPQAIVFLGNKAVPGAPADDLNVTSSVTGSAAFLNQAFVTNFVKPGPGTTGTVSLNTGQIGAFSETITLHPSGTNSSGFSEALPDQVLTVTGTVTAPPRQMLWIGGANTDFSTAGNWLDATDNQNPAALPPNGSDTAIFNSGATGITGSGTVSSLVFAGANAWHVGAGVALNAQADISVDQATVLQLNGGATHSAGRNATVSGQPGSEDSEIDVSGTGSQLNVAGVLTIAGSGSGGLEVSGGATVTAGSLDAGNFLAGVGRIDVAGPGSSLAVIGDATVADDGTGVLSVLNGASFSATNLTIGSQGDSSGALIVSGSGSVINLTGSLNIGTALGVGDLTIGPGGAVHAAVVNLQGQVVLEGGNLDPTVTIINQGQTAGGNGTLQAGDIIDEGVVQAGGTKPSQRLLVVQGTVLGGGTLTINGTVQPSNPAGVLQINASGTLELTGPVLNAATTTFTDNLAQPGTYTVNNSVVDVTFADALGVLLLDDIAGFGGTITSFKGGDSFVITGGTLSNLGVSNSNTLTFSDSGLNAGSGGIDQIIFGSAVNAGGFSIVNGNTVQVACFAAGTRIETAGGPVPVEDLVVGDTLRTVLGGAGEIVWIGQRTVNCATHPRPESVWPVRIERDALAENMPSRDLFVSPDHALYVDGVLIPAKYLMNGRTIRQVEVGQVTWFHVELARHDVILAEGMPAETYLDTGDRAKFSGGSVTRLYPDFATRAWEMKGCAELVVTGERLDAVRARITARAGELLLYRNGIRQRA